MHGLNMLVVSLLVRVHQQTGEPELVDIARKTGRYTMEHHRADACSYYGERQRWCCPDAHDTDSVLHAPYWYVQAAGHDQYEDRLLSGTDLHRQQLFSGGKPKHDQPCVYPIDIQGMAQDIQSFSLITVDVSWRLGLAGAGRKLGNRAHAKSDRLFLFLQTPLHDEQGPVPTLDRSTTLAALALLLFCRQVAPRLATSAGEMAKANERGAR